MAKITRMLTYTRDRSITKNKFDGLYALIRDAAKSNMSALLVDSPQVLGDTFEELVANLDELATADLALIIVPPKHRTT